VNVGSFLNVVREVKVDIVKEWFIRSAGFGAN